MNTKFCTMYQEALAKAFIVLTPQGKRLAIFPYGAGEDDVPEKQARKHAWLFLNRLNGQAEPQAQAEDTCENCANLNGGRYCEMKRMLIGMRYSPACEVFRRKGDKA